jgi:hypothetical protein
MDAAERKEIKALKAKLEAAEATIARLASSASLGNQQQAASMADEQADVDHSRFPLFRKVQRGVTQSLDRLKLPQTSEGASAGFPYLASEKEVKEAPESSVQQLFKQQLKEVPESSVEQLFQKYDVDASGLLDIDEFRAFLKEIKLPNVDLSVPDFRVLAKDTAASAAKSAESLVSGTAKSAETFASDTARSADDFAKSVSRSVNDLAKGVNDLAASAGVPGATARVPVTIVGGLGSGYKEILSATSSGKDLPVEPLILAIERQATLTMQLGGFMQLIVKLDQGNMRTVRESWERHGRPSSLRELLEAEVAEGVVEPARLKEGSAALSLLWSMRAKRFWTTVADGFADKDSTESSTAFGTRAYENELEPYHAFLFRNTFRAGLRALPSRKDMLQSMALMPAESMGLGACWQGWEESAAAGKDLTPEERMAACLVELRECSEATKRVTNLVQAQLDELGLRDDRKL